MAEYTLLQKIFMGTWSVVMVAAAIVLIILIYKLITDDKFF
jgi:hypothetical protein